MPSTVPSTRSGSCKSHSTQPSLPHRLCQRLLRQVIGPVANGRIIACIHAPLDLVKRAKLSQSSGLWPTPTQITPWLEAMWRRIGWRLGVCAPHRLEKGTRFVASPRTSPKIILRAPVVLQGPCLLNAEAAAVKDAPPGWILACLLSTAFNLCPGVRFFFSSPCISTISPCPHLYIYDGDLIGDYSLAPSALNRFPRHGHGTCPLVHHRG